MRILVCASEAPLPPLNGLRLQLAQLCRELAARHELTVLAFRWPGQRGRPEEGIELIELTPPPRSRAGRLRTRAAAALRGEPAAARVLEPRMREAARALTASRSFDVAHVTSGANAGVVPALGTVPSVLAALDAWHLNVAAQARAAPAHLRPLLRLEERRVRHFVASRYRACETVVTVTREDAAALRELDPGLRLEVVPNGVDTATFTPGGSVVAEPGHLVFTGAMHYAPNVAAARFLALRILPRVRATRPDARLTIVGRDPRQEVRALAALEGVSVTGEVPDMPAWLRRAQVYVCPMTSGTGIKNKLLEALACGVPSVATPLACQGLDVTHGEQLLVAAGEEALAAAVLRALGDADLRRRLAGAGRDFVIERHAWSRVAAAYEAIYRRAAASAPS